MLKKIISHVFIHKVNKSQKEKENAGGGRPS